VVRVVVGFVVAAAGAALEFRNSAPVLTFASGLLGDLAIWSGFSKVLNSCEKYIQRPLWVYSGSTARRNTQSVQGSQG